MQKKIQDEEFLSIVRQYPESDPSWFGMLIQVKKNKRFTRTQLTKFLEDNKI